MEYDFRRIEESWKKIWEEQQVYKVSNNNDQPKFYVLDMFPYPSGAGLHVGHPLGYIASDIYARYKRMKGFNVLHPMGFDAFGLPAEQYAIETGQHPAVTTEKNIARYREQLDNIGFCYDWSRQVRTSDPKYYKWTQWIFLQLFHSWYNRKENKASNIEELVALFEKEGNINTPCPGDETIQFDAATWKSYTDLEQRNVLMQYRLAYLDYAEVWWCEALGTVLANDEVVNGVSERGGHPTVRKKMRQWFLRITEYADRLLTSLDNLEWTEAMKEMQRNWIGKSQGAEITFTLADSQFTVDVFTTRPDTIFGVDFMVIAPEHDLVEKITTDAQKEAITKYKEYVQSRSERERISEVKQVTGAFTGAYAIHPFTQKQIPVWISEYVLAGYGTGAIMAVPSGDDRDHAFAQHFNIPVTNIFGDKYTREAAFTEKSNAPLHNSAMLNGLDFAKATETILKAIEEQGIGKRKVNYRLRDAGFSRQRYWGEPFPIIYDGETPYAIDEPGLGLSEQDSQLPVVLPNVDSYQPGPEGQGPLANIPEFVNVTAGNKHYTRETNTMPGYAGSSWYFLRYMDPQNDVTFADRNATDYWEQVDVYVGGTEHAVGHLLYSRMWTKALHDLGHISFDEPFRKLVNQGMIQGVSELIFNTYKTNTGEYSDEEWADINNNPEIHNRFISADIWDKDYAPVRGLPIERHVAISLTNSSVLDIPKFVEWRAEFKNYIFETEGGYWQNGVFTSNGNGGSDKFKTKAVVEKMSKSKYNVVNPDDIVTQFGADTFRMYEMFLGPLEQSKPWDTKGIEGVHRFLKKLWRLYFDEQKGLIVEDAPASETALRTLHKTIKKLGEDIEKFAFNTCVSQLMICVNELTAANCHNREVLEPLAQIICPFAPHLAAELWQKLGHNDQVVAASFPAYEEKYVTDSSKKYPVAVNGKTRTELEFPLDAAQADIEKAVMADETIIKWLEGKTPKKIIFVQGRMINVVI